MVTYRACFTHHRIYHPQRMNWELMMHDLPHHNRIHLEAVRCDLCTGEHPDTRQKTSSLWYHPLTKPQ